MHRALLLPSPAKLNLFLHINGRLANGYHELQTLFQFVDYGDTMRFKARTDRQVELNTAMTGVPHEDNLIVRAARLLQQHTGCNLGIEIELAKRLPMGGGIGGGSSNAATTLLACNVLWGLQLSLLELAQIGLQLGADVPVFVHGHATLAEGVGEKFTDMTPDEPWYLVVHPGVDISTPDIFASPELPRTTPKQSPETLNAGIWHNDCENIVRKQYPQVEKALCWLLEYAPSRLTGTGSCVFGKFNHQAQAHQALLNLPKSMTGFVAQGCNVSPLHQVLQRITNT